MHLKIIADTPKISYVDFKTKTVLSGDNYTEAVTFIQSIFNIQDAVTVKVKDVDSFMCAIPAVPAAISIIAFSQGLANSSFPSILIGGLSIAYAIVLRILHGIAGSNSNYNSLFKYIWLNDSKPCITIHETIHYLAAAKIIPNLDTYFARAAEASYMLIKQMENGKKLTGYPVRSFSEVTYFELGYKFYDSGFTGIRTKGIIKKFNKIQKNNIFNNNIFLHGEEYEIGAFVAGIVKGILLKTRNVNDALLFLNKLAAGLPLETVMAEVPH